MGNSDHSTTYTYTASRVDTGNPHGGRVMIRGYSSVITFLPWTQSLPGWGACDDQGLQGYFAKQPSRRTLQ